MKILLASRPRFWLYLFGPALIGYMLSKGFSPLLSIAVLAFFTFPANYILYTINDYFDTKTDRLNRKKMGYETAVSTNHISVTIFVLCILYALVLLIFLPHPLWMLLFLLFSIIYSAPPRLKGIPVLDSASNVLYLLPAYVFIGTSSVEYFVAGWLWCSAMHLFSAIPDIEPDTRANIMTTARWLGKNISLLAVWALWTASAMLINSPWSYAVGLLYSVCVVMMYRAPQSEELYVYRRMPYINGLVGFSLFLLVVLQTYLP